MILVDTNIWINYFKGTQDKHTDLLDSLLEQCATSLIPFVLTELLASPKLPASHQKILLALPVISLKDGFFERAGYLARAILKKGKGVSFSDLLIAQVAIDANATLLSLDGDFKIIASCSKLSLN